jgi:hypothetical protein
MSYEVGSGEPITEMEKIRGKNVIPSKVFTEAVDSPPHYNQSGIECIQAIEASMSKEEFQGYCKGNAQKYLWRYKYKGKEKEDLQKAQWYLNRLVETL